MTALDSYERPLTRYAERMFGSSSRDSLEEARDAVQHTFMKLCEQDPAEIEHKLAPWLYSVCRNRVIDQLRKAGRLSGDWPPPIELTDQQMGPADKASQAEFFERLAQLIANLSGSQREIIELWSQGFNHQKIAEILNKSQTAVRVGLHRGIQKLKRHPDVCNWLERATSPDRQPKTESANAEPVNGKSNTKLAFFQKQAAITQGENYES